MAQANQGTFFTGFLNCGRDRRRGTRCFCHHADPEEAADHFRWLRPLHREPPRPSASLHPLSLRSSSASGVSSHHAIPLIAGDTGGRMRGRVGLIGRNGCRQYSEGNPTAASGDGVRRRSDRRLRFPRVAKSHPSAAPVTSSLSSTPPGEMIAGKAIHGAGGAGPLGPGMAAFAPAEHVTHTAVMPGRRA